MTQPRSISRRGFVATSTVAGTSLLLGQSDTAQGQDTTREPFKLGFAPHPGMFKASAGGDVIDQIKFAHDQGFSAWEHNSLAGESKEMQTKVGKTLADLGMQMGVFVAYASFDEPSFTAGGEQQQQAVLESVRKAIDVARRCGAKWFTVVPGSVDQQKQGIGTWDKYGGGRLAPGYQMANVVDLLRRCSELIEPHNLVMVLEPLNWYANHGGVFLRYADQAYAVCRAVDSPSCKILFDIYHQQITEGNLIPNIDLCWNEIGYFQSGDNPGRKEPGTGEIHYKNVFGHIAQRASAEGRDLVIGMEHGNSRPGKEGEQAVIAAYRAVDAA